MRASSAFDICDERAEYPFIIYAVMIVKSFIFKSDERFFKIIGNIVSVCLYLACRAVRGQIAVYVVDLGQRVFERDGVYVYIGIRVDINDQSRRRQKYEK